MIANDIECKIIYQPQERKKPKSVNNLKRKFTEVSTSVNQSIQNDEETTSGLPRKRARILDKVIVQDLATESTK